MAIKQQPKHNWVFFRAHGSMPAHERCSKCNKINQVTDNSDIICTVKDQHKKR